MIKTPKSGSKLKRWFGTNPVRCAECGHKIKFGHTNHEMITNFYDPRHASPDKVIRTKGYMVSESPSSVSCF